MSGALAKVATLTEALFTVEQELAGEHDDRKAAEAQIASFVAALEKMAAEWEDEDAWEHPAYAQCAKDLRAVLATVRVPEV